jgi:hypothetical protein
MCAVSSLSSRFLAMPPALPRSATGLASQYLAIPRDATWITSHYLATQLSLPHITSQYLATQLGLPHITSRRNWDYLTFSRTRHGLHRRTLPALSHHFLALPKLKLVWRRISKQCQEKVQCWQPLACVLTFCFKRKQHHRSAGFRAPARRSLLPIDRPIDRPGGRQADQWVGRPIGRESPGERGPPRPTCHSKNRQINKKETKLACFFICISFHICFILCFRSLPALGRPGGSRANVF